jgi:phosphomannomutase
MQTIKFGTDGWRAEIADGFTFENLGKVTDAFAVYVRRSIKKPRVAIGYDNRFLSDKYAAFTAEKLSGCGFDVLLFDSAVPTPMVSFCVVKKKLDYGIVITSSHNPYTYNGFKIKNRFGAGVSTAETAEIEGLIAGGAVPKKSPGKLTPVNIDGAYVRTVASIVDIAAIKKSGMKVVLDDMYGPGAKYMEMILDNYRGLSCIHAKRDPLFGSINPEPIRKNLMELELEVKSAKADIGIALDGDSDRMAFVDDRGKFIPTHKALVISLLHHAMNRGIKFRFVKTISGTSLLNIIAKEYGIELLETPVGFKYIGDLIIKDKNTIGGEESGGLGFGYYLPERDGIVANLLLLEFLAKEGKKPSQVLDELNEKYGNFEYDRIDVKFDPDKRGEITAKVGALEKEGLIAGKKIISVNNMDGIKYILSEREWLLFRFSGTEPLLRIYSEAPSSKEVWDNLNFGKKSAE